MLDEEQSFGNYIAELRESMDISTAQLCSGLCDITTMSRLEAGEREANKLLQDRLLERLGVIPENYENFLWHTEYERWSRRQQILQAILQNSGMEAKDLLQRYEAKYDMTNPLEKQFCLSMQIQLYARSGACQGTMKKLCRSAAELTVPDVDRQPGKETQLSVKEINLLVEMLYYSGDEHLSHFQRWMEYLKDARLEQLAKAKIYPKAVWYLYQCWKDEGSREINEAAKLLKYCRGAFEVLQKANRSFYLWELTCMKEELLLTILKNTREEKRENYIRLYSELVECQELKNIWKTLYEEQGIPLEMHEFCYLYIDREVYCIEDVIHIRRAMFGLTKVKLAWNLCDERTVGRLEHKKTKAQRRVVRQLFDRLHLSTELYRTELVAGSREAKHLQWELRACCNNWETTRAEELLERLKTLIPLEISSNRQFVMHYEAQINRKKGLLSREEYINQLKAALECTIPYRLATQKGELYLTLEEITCLQNIMTQLKAGDPEKEVCVETLLSIYDKPEALNHYLHMYELVMSAIASHLGNLGEYDRSDEIELTILKACLYSRRTYSLAGALYGLLWNDEQRSKQQLPMHRAKKPREELERCLTLSIFNNAKRRIEFLKRKLDEEA